MAVATVCLCNCDKSVAPKALPDFSPSGSPHIQDSLVQQLLKLTGDVRVKLVWLQSRMIDDDTTAFVPSVSDYLFNYPGSQLVAFDTDEKTGRFLDSIPSARGTPLITRDGSKVLWTDFGKKAIYSINWDGTGKKILLQGNFYQVICVQWDYQLTTEWVYVSDVLSFSCYSMPGGSVIYRYPFNGIELDTTKREFVSDKIYSTPWTASGDGKYGGADIDWPKACIETLPNGPLYIIGDTNRANCHAQIAPDTSYLFFYLTGDHSNLHMYKFTTYLQSVNISMKMPGNNGMWDCCAPRWTNNCRYLTCGYPYTTAYFSIYNPAQPIPVNPKTLAPGASGEFCIGKFNQDFTAVEWILITDLDTRFRKVIGDAWLADGEGPNKPRF